MGSKFCHIFGSQEIKRVKYLEYGQGKKWLIKDSCGFNTEGYLGMYATKEHYFWLQWTCMSSRKPHSMKPQCYVWKMYIKERKNIKQILQILTYVKAVGQDVEKLFLCKQKVFISKSKLTLG